MKEIKWQLIGLLLAMLCVGFVIAAEPMTTMKEMKQIQEKKAMKKSGMKHKVKSYGEVVLEQTEVLDLTDEQLGRITRIHMTNKKIRKKLLEQPHKSMKKVFKTLRNPAADESMIRKAGARHSTDFDVLLEAELQVRKKIDAVLTPKQRTKLIAMKLPKENETSE